MSQKIGKYEVLEEIGRGGMGIVYCARDTQNGQKAAVKVLPPGMASDPRFVERFQVEIRAMSRIRHSHIVKILDSGKFVDEETGATSFYYAMEYIEGETLAASLGRGKPLPVSKVLEFGRELADAMSAAHQEGIIHRDLKPSNVMVLHEGAMEFVKIMDFGVAREVDPHGKTATGGSVGTVEYMSPEQVRGEVVDRRSDLYSLGVLIYQMATGRLPFGGKTPAAILQAHLNLVPERAGSYNPYIPKDLDRIITRLLEKSPERRFSSALEVAAAIDECLRRYRPVYCPNCKEQIPEGSVICVICGTDLQTGKKIPPTRVVTRTTRSRRLAAIFILLMVSAWLSWYLWPRGIKVTDTPGARDEQLELFVGAQRMFRAQEYDLAESGFGHLLEHAFDEDVRLASEKYLEMMGLESPGN